MLDALTLSQMQMFAVVAETGSFRAGADRLHRVQSAVSQACLLYTSPSPRD